MLTAAEIASLNARFATAPTEEILRWAWERFGARAAIGTSFQGAGLVMMHLARQHGLPFPVFTIDTGLLFPETAALHRRLEEFFGHPIETLVPDLTVAQQAAAHGPELWQRDPDLCCTLRKVLPLQDRLSRLEAWLTGLRRERHPVRHRRRRTLRRGCGQRAGAREAQPDGELEPRGGVGPPQTPWHSLSPAARPGLSQHRLPALHPPGGWG